MRKIELLKEGKAGLKGRLLKTNAFQHHTGYQINIFPFNTRAEVHGFKADFQSFQGVIGEVFRILTNKTLEKPDGLETYKSVLKNQIIENAIIKVEPKEHSDFENILTNVYFDSDNGLYKYDFHVISYMNYVNNKYSLKDIAHFLVDVFLDNQLDFKELITKPENDNILNQLISDCLPELKERKDTKKEKQPFKNLFKPVTEIFQRDFEFLLKPFSNTTTSFTSPNLHLSWSYLVRSTKR